MDRVFPPGGQDASSKARPGLPADKMSACATFGAVLFFPAVVVPQHEGDRNGLEDTEDRRSAGRHGNQHVCLRGAQVTETSQPPARRRFNAVLRSLRRAGGCRVCKAVPRTIERQKNETSTVTVCRFRHDRRSVSANSIIFVSDPTAGAAKCRRCKVFSHSNTWARYQMTGAARRCATHVGNVPQPDVLRFSFDNGPIRRIDIGIPRQRVVAR